MKTIYCACCCRYIGNKYSENDEEFDKEHLKLPNREFRVPDGIIYEALEGEDQDRYLCSFCEKQYNKVLGKADAKYDRQNKTTESTGASEE